MSWFTKVEKQKNLLEFESAPDKDNPYSWGVEDEGELVTIVHTRNIEPLDDKKPEEKDDGGTSNKQRISK